MRKLEDRQMDLKLYQKLHSFESSDLLRFPRAKAWRKRKYTAVFKNKLTDSMQEASETQSWLEFCLACHYIEEPLFRELDDEYEGIISMLNAMDKNAKKFCFSSP